MSTLWLTKHGGQATAALHTSLKGKLQALVYDILPPTTAINDYAIGLEKLSANEVFQYQYNLLQTTQTVSGSVFYNRPRSSVTPAEIKPKSFCRGAGWGVREAGRKHEWRVTSQRLL